MKQAAKVLIRDPKGRYLLLRLNNHPTFFNDPDLPGGTVDEGESAKVAAIREVSEEVGINLESSGVKEIYSGSEYSKNVTKYFLYKAQLDSHPDVTLSWEHESYEWVDEKTLLEQAEEARDTYMHMVRAVLKDVR
jgi:8-oxo-dGTP pyrophosphatase MutT (NUDIX family)